MNLTKKMDSLSLVTKRLSENVKIYVPSTFNLETGETINLSETEHLNFVKWIEKGLSDRFGGVTTYEAFGSYIMEDGALIREKMTIVQAFADRVNNDDIDLVWYYAVELWRQLNQEAVTVEINNELYIIGKN